MNASADIRTLDERDAEVISSAFQRAGIPKPTSQYLRYLADQQAGSRSCLIATIGRDFCGYLTVNWKPSYSSFAEAGIPEIQDLNVLPAFRRRGIATLLLGQAEAGIFSRSRIAGISVGLHPGYNQAQRLYVRRGYIPDGHGVTYRNEYVREGMEVRLDDDLLLHLTKDLASKGHHA